MEEFDAIFLRAMYQDDGYSAERAAIKSFISALLIAEREKMAKEVEGLRVNKVLHCSNPACGKESHPCQNPVYNKTIEVIAALIRKEQ